MMTKARRVTRKVMVSAFMLVLAAGSGQALADLPRALDRVPGNAAITISVRNMAQAHERMKSLMTALDIPADDGPQGGPVGTMGMLLATPGLNTGGSMAIAVMPEADGTVSFETAEGPVVMIVPVTDFAAFTQALEGKADGNIVAVTIGGNEAFTRDIGGGFLAMSPRRDLVEGFKGDGGNLAAHTQSVGAIGNRIGNDCDMLIVASIPALRTQLQEGVAQIEEQGAGLAMMAGGIGAEPDMFKGVQMIAGNFVRDARVGIVGLSMGEQGIIVDIAAQFEKDTELAGFFGASGNSGAALDRLPRIPYLLAGSIDMSHPGIRRMMAPAEGAAAEGNAAPGMLGALAAWRPMLDKVNSQSFVVGANPAAMMGGGLLVNTVSYTGTADPAALMAANRAALLKMDKQTIEGSTWGVTYSPAMAEISGTKVDSWTASVTLDANDENAMQAQMMQSMMFGAAGMGGMAASVDGGVVLTMSQNTPLMNSALTAARGGEGLGTDVDLIAIRERLPQNRVAEFYLGSKSIFDSIAGIMAMMGGPADFTVPDKLAPVALAAEAGEAGVNFRIVVPADVMKLISELGAGMQAGDPMGEDAPGDDSGPRF